MNEFQFLESDAERVGRTDPLPEVKRVEYTASSGRKISTLHFGEITSTPLVFLHGAGLNAHTFDPTILALGQPAVVLDLPGHGRSDWRPDGIYSPFVMASDVASVIKQFATGGVHLIGHSLGGLTSAQIAKDYPELVKSVTVVDITPGIVPNRDAGSISEFISGQKDFGSVDEIVDRAIAFNIGHDRVALTRGVTLNTRTREDGRLEWTHHLAHLAGLEVTHEEQPAGTKIFESLWQPLASLGENVHVVQATEGIVSDELVAEVRKQLPQAKVSTLQGGHNLHEHNPIGLAALLGSGFSN